MTITTKQLSAHLSAHLSALNVFYCRKIVALSYIYTTVFINVYKKIQVGNRNQIFCMQGQTWTGFASTLKHLMYVTECA